MSDEKQSNQEEPTKVPFVIPFKTDYKLVTKDSESFTEIIETINTKVKITVRKNSDSTDIPDFELSAIGESNESMASKRPATPGCSKSATDAAEQEVRLLIEEHKNKLANPTGQSSHLTTTRRNSNEQIRSSSSSSSGHPPPPDHAPSETCHTQILEAIEKSLKKHTNVVRE